MAPKKAAKKQEPKKVYDYSGLEKGMKCQAESDGDWYAAEILVVSTSKNRAKAPVKVSYKGYEGYDEWVSGARLRSKALKVTVEKPKPKEKKPPKVIKVGDKIPSVILDEGFNPIEKVDLAEATKGKKQVPGYLKMEADLKAKGIDEVLVYCVNDGAVMQAWAKDQKIEGTIIRFLADTRCQYTRKIGMSILHPGPRGALGNIRCKRHALVVNDGEVIAMEVSEGPDDPAGDNEPDGPVTAVTRVEHILTLL